MLAKAPNRGCYDRRTNRGERSSTQRERVLAATAAAFAEGTASVNRIVAIAGIGRATFYELFDDAEHAIATVRERVLARARHELAPSVDGGIDLVCERWLAFVRHDPAAALVALECRLHELAPIAELLRPAFTRFAGQRRALEPSVALEPERTDGVEFALIVAQVSATRVARATLTRDRALAGAASATPDRGSTPALAAAVTALLQVR